MCKKNISTETKKENIDILINNAGFGDCGYFTETDLVKVRDTLLSLENDGFLYEKISYRNPIIMFVVSFLFGMWGLDRFLLGETKNGLIKFFTMGLFGLWTLFDWIMIVKLTKEYNYRLFHSLVNKLY